MRPAPASSNRQKHSRNGRNRVISWKSLASRHRQSGDFSQDHAPNLNSDLAGFMRAFKAGAEAPWVHRPPAATACRVPSWVVVKCLAELLRQCFGPKNMKLFGLSPIDYFNRWFAEPIRMAGGESVQSVIDARSRHPLADDETAQNYVMPPRRYWERSGRFRILDELQAGGFEDLGLSTDQHHQLVSQTLSLRTAQAGELGRSQRRVGHIDLPPLRSRRLQLNRSIVVGKIQCVQQNDHRNYRIELSQWPTTKIPCP